MSCSTSGSMRSLSPAWRRARSRCSWSTPARSACSDAAAFGSPDEDMRRQDLPLARISESKSLRISIRRLGSHGLSLAREESAAQRFAFLAFFFAAFFATFLVAFLPAFLTAFLPAFFAAFLLFLAFFAAFAGATFLATFLAAFFALRAGFGLASGSVAITGISSVTGVSSSILSPNVKQSRTIARFPRLSKYASSSGRAQLRVSRQRAFATGPMIDDRLGVGEPEGDAGALEFDRCCLPRLVDQRGRQTGEFGHPAPYIVALGIELLALQDRIEHPEIGGGVCPGAGDPLPVRRIAGGIRVDEGVPEPALALSPVDQEMLDQE